MTSGEPSTHQTQAILRDTAEVVGPEGHTSVCEALRAERELNRRLLDSSGDRIEVLSLDGRVESINAGGLRLMDLAPANEDAGSEWLLRWEEGEARDEARRAVAAARGGAAARLRGPGRTASGRVRIWDAVLTPILGPDGRPERLLSVARDVTAEDEALGRLREAATVAERIGEGVLLLGPDFHVRRINAEALRIDSRPESAIVGRHILELWPEAEQAPTWPLYLRCMADRTPGELVYRHPEASRSLWLAVRVHPVEDGLAVLYRDVTEEMVAREAAERSGALLTAFVESVPGVVFAKDRQGRMLLANRGTTDLIGKPPEVYLGRTDAEFLDDPVEAAAVMANDAQVMASGEARSFEEEVSLPGGERAVWLSTKAPFRDAAGEVVGLVGTSVDITARRRAEEELQASEREFRLRLDALPQMVWSTRRDGFHDFFNDRWYEFTGVPAGSTDGEGWADIFHADDVPEAQRRWRASLASGEPYEVEYRLRHRSGRYRWVLGRALPVRDAHGRIRRWMGTCTDIEGRKRAEAALSEALEAKEVLLHEVNHRVKNSLQLVIALLTLQAGQAQEPALRRGLMEARGRLGVVASLHQRLYATSRHDRVDIGDYLGEMVAETLASLDAGGRIRLEVEAEREVVVPLAQAVPLGLIVSELVTNAIKYAFVGRDGGRLGLTLRRVGAGVRIVVEDDGVGLPPGFDPHRTGGLGMRIVTALLGQARGTLAVAGSDGSAFVIEVPIGEPDPASPRPAGGPA